MPVVAIDGYSGSGKTTLACALGRLLDVTGGATTKAEQMDLSNTESTQIKEALAAIGRAPVL